jgi:hypothetical protein
MRGWFGQSPIYDAAPTGRSVCWKTSGDATERRHEFLRMHKAATNDRDFDVILCWDYSRIGRFDSIEAGRWIYPLRQAGVKLVTVAEGVVDWECFSGRIMNALHAEGSIHPFYCMSAAPRLCRCIKGSTSGGTGFGYCSRVNAVNQCSGISHVIRCSLLVNGF